MRFCKRKSRRRTTSRVLGRQGFFEKFKVTFDEVKKEVELKERV